MCALPIPWPYELTGEVKYFKTWNFLPQNTVATIIHLSYSLEILINKRPKGPHIVHLSTMCRLFDRSARTEIFVYSSAWKKQSW